MAGLIPQSTLEQIRAASDIVDVIGGYFPLKRNGANFVALCPFHREKSPSFNVHPQKQIFHCFGCHKGGDVFTFVQEYEHIPFMDAVRRLAERANIVIELDDRPGDREARGVKDTLLNLHEQLTQRWHAVLLNDAAGQAGRDYLARRGVSEEAIKRFRLGCAPALWDDTVNWAKSKGFDLNVVEKGGLILKREGGDGWYDRFRGRLMFPICDEQGRVVGFSGRVLSGDEKTAKYVNSPETPIFTKGRIIFGLDKAKRAMLDKEFAIVCEGQLDLIACHMAGVENVVAPQGTALTADHARILKRYVQEVVLCFDSDAAGQNAAARSLDALMGADLAIRVATLPSPHDPDSFIKENGGPAFAELIQEAEGYFDYRLNRLCGEEDITTDRGRKVVLNEIIEALLKSNDAVLVDKVIQKTAARLGVQVAAVRTQLNKARRPGRFEPASEPTEDHGESEPMERPTPAEFQLLKLLLTGDELAPMAIAFLDPEWIGHAAARKIIEARLEAERAGDWRGPAAMLDNTASAQIKSLITEASADPRKMPDPTRQLEDIMKRLRNDHYERQIALLGQRLEHPQASEDEKVAVLQEQQRLRHARREPLQELHHDDPADG